MQNQSINPRIAGLSPYKPGKPVEEVARELGINDIVKLASNENPWVFVTGQFNDVVNTKFPRNFFDGLAGFVRTEPCNTRVDGLVLHYHSCPLAFG